MASEDPPGDTDLRLRAENRLHSAQLPGKAPLAENETQRLLHELQVYQIELELQNEELRASRAQGEAGLARYTDLYDFSPVGYFTLSRFGEILQTNLAGARLLGKERARVLGKRFSLSVAQADLPSLNTFLERVFAVQPHEACELRLATESRLTVQIEATLASDGGTCNAVVTDITAHKQAQAHLLLAASVFTHTRDGIIICSPDGKIIDVNAAFTRITGYAREEVLGKEPCMFNSGQQSPEFYAEMRRTLTHDGMWSGELRNRRKNGESYIESTTISAVRNATGQTLNTVTLFTDITAMKEHQQQLEHIAHYDGLTHLPNRVLLADRLQRAMIQSLRQERSLAVAFLDLDGFKAVNDMHGHDVGDELLVCLAQQMKAVLREGDTLARIGGDEFVAVLVDIKNLSDCTPLLNRLLQAAITPVKRGERVLQVSASIGVTLFPQDKVAAEQLIRHADHAMYQAKQSGKNRYHLFDVHQDLNLQTQGQEIERIREALAKREFVLYYQPKVNMRTGEVIGVEALIRWQHPQRGLLQPDSFLPLIENHPISVELGEWVEDTALSQIAAWHASGRDIPVSVNVGAFQLQQDEFVPHLAALLLAHPDVQSRLLELEILETSALQDIAGVSRVMHDCQALGVRFALDDFGTGYASLSYLKHLPAELLKIDKSFVLSMIDDADDRAIVEGVIGLVRAFHREVIAEGVETQAHRTLLLALGCEQAQGYGIAHPMPAAEFPAWMADWQSRWLRRGADSELSSGH